MWSEGNILRVWHVRLRSIVPCLSVSPGSAYGAGVSVGVMAGIVAVAGAGVTANPLRCGQTLADPLPMDSTPHEVKASGAAAGSAVVGAPAPAVAVPCGVAVAVAVGVPVGVLVAPEGDTDVISGVH